MAQGQKRLSFIASKTPPTAISIPNGSPNTGRSLIFESPSGMRRSSSGSSFTSFASSPAYSNSPLDSPSGSPSPGSPLNLSTADFDTGYGEGYIDASYSKACNFVSGVKLKASAEHGRSDHTAVLFEDDMYLYGGVVSLTSGENGATTDIHVFNFASRSFNVIGFDDAAVQPTPRWQHTAVVNDTSMVIFAGSSLENVLLNDLWAFSFESRTWSEIVPSTDVRPSPRRGHSAVLVGRCLYIFGGSGPSGALNDMYKFDFETLTWTLLTSLSGEPPCPRYLHTAIVHNNSILIFAGTDGDSAFGDLFEYKIATNIWEEIQCEPPCPLPRCNHAAAVFHNSMFIIGGDAETDQIDIYEFDIPARRWYRILPSAPGIMRSGHSVIVRGESLFIFGGTDEGSPFATALDVLVLGQKDDFEEDLLQESTQDEEVTRALALPRPVWEAVLLKKHPEILQYRELTRPLTGVKTYARSKQAATTEDPSHLSYHIVLNLIVEHLHTLGLTRAANAIVDESKVPYFPVSSQPDSRLALILRTIQSRAKLSKEKIFDSEFVLSSSRSSTDPVDPEVEMIDHMPGAGRIDAQQDGEEDLDIWEEKEDSRKNIMRGKDDNGKSTIRGANLNKLVQALTMDRDKTPDAVYLKTFFYTYQSFTSPENLLKKLVQKYNVPLPKSGIVDERHKKEVIEPVQTRVCRVLKFWIEQCPWDFNGPSSEKLLNNLNAFIDGPLSKDGNVQLVKQLRNSIQKSLKKRTSSEEAEKTITAGFNPPEPKVPRNIFSPHLSLKDVDELEIARQLTLIEFNIFANITPVEFLNKGWEDPNPKKSPHLKELITRATDLSRYVAQTILKVDAKDPKENPKKLRAKMLEKWIRVADQLRTLKNFQTMFAVVNGFTHASVIRQHHIFGEIAPRTKELYQEMFLFAKDDKNTQYREILRSVPLPCIPSIDIELADLLVAQDVPDNINNLINFQKRQQMYQYITKFQGYQQRQFNLLPVHQIASLVNKIPKISEKELEELSRAANEEKSTK